MSADYFRVRRNRAPRERELMHIHLAKAQLGMDDDHYRDFLWTVARVRSAKDLNHEGRKALLEHLRSLGYRPGYPGVPRGEEPIHKRLRSAWLTLRDAGVLDDSSEHALVTYCNRHIELPNRVDAIKFLNPDQCARLIEQLKSWHWRVRCESAQRKELGGD